jgi:putative spermidine/putrescine transport system permease protein
MFVAALFAFVIAFDELVVALFVSGTSATTLPKRMWDGLQTEINPTIAAASSILIGISFLLFGLAEFARKRARTSNQGLLPHI